MHRRALTAFGLLSFTVSVAAAAQKLPPFPLAGMGYEFLDPASVTAVSPLPISDRTASEASPLYLRFELPWSEIEKKEGVFRWEEADSVVDRFRTEKHEVILDLWGGNPLYSEEILNSPTASEPKSVEAWEKFVRETARHFKGRVSYFQIGKIPNAAAFWGGADPAKAYAFLLKKSAVIVRAEAKGAAIVAGGIAGADAAWLEQLYAEGAAPYLDVVALRPDARADLGAQCDAIQAVILEKDASARLWLESVPVSRAAEEAGRDLLRKLLTGLEHGAGLVTFALPYGAGNTPVDGEYLVRAHSAIGKGFGLVPAGERISFTDPAGGSLPAVRAVSFYNPEDGIAVTAFWGEGAAAPATATARISARRPGPPTVYDPITGEQMQPKFEPAPGGAQGEVPVRPSPVFVVYRESTSGAGLPDTQESLEVTAARGITAEEIIAKYREFQASQDAILKHDRSDAMINFHFRLAGTSTTIDVGLGGSYFYDPKGGAEWEIRDYYLNGIKSKWKEFPELPLIQPEKVMTLPLDITFDRSYSYVLDGEETIEGRKCHVLSFTPVDPTRTLYRGRVWIDEASFARVRVSSVQTNVEPPFLSNEERSTYTTMTGPDGADYWVISRIDGQQIYSTGGRSFIVLRDIVFSNHRINDPGFESSRQEAYNSNHQILRDTEKGFRYLEKTPTGERRVKYDMDTNQLFGLGGVLYDPSLKHPVPLLGVNYFDYNFKKTGVQTNLFFAGVLGSLNVTHPNFMGTGLELGSDLSLTVLRRTDREFENGEEIESQNVRVRRQSLSFNLGHQIGDFLKLRTSYGLSYQTFTTDDDTANSFILPHDTLVQSVELSGTWNRAGYEIHGEGSYAVRRDFRFWGRPGGQDFDPAAKGYYKYELGASKEIFLPAFQKLRFAVEGYDGSDLDRFSRYTFDRFGARARGFAGSGVRFDNGAIVRAAYLFNIANAIRFEAAIDQAHVRTRGPESETTNHTGLGIAANILGPWKTVWQLDYGYALRSDIKPVRGDQEVLLAILKLF